MRPTAVYCQRKKADNITARTLIEAEGGAARGERNKGDRLPTELKALRHISTSTSYQQWASI